ncbi:stage III sporulation protein AF [Paenibacillus kobensis]|uniref:stage III sporulation protein AF n=1 Tax=Paenibacillus kobensis TaxID=59841 RepID=UPI000FD84988|nr:stage III sporulation protein AF [Paenibacillus kobensis]
MLDWLSGWLREIITVILLAAIVDLLLPNKAMQRYARLVVGLIVLLTILSPLLKVFQGDFNKKVEAGMNAWDKASAEHYAEMPTLQDITKEAERISREQQRQASALAERQLAAAMEQELDTRLKTQGTKAVVTLDAAGKSIESVRITLQPNDHTDSKDSGSSSSSQDQTEIAPIDIAVDVSVQLDMPAAETSDSGAGQDEPTVEPAVKSEVEHSLRQGWGVAADRIDIRMAGA